MKVVFATPAYKRLDISDICFAQHAWCHQKLAEQGIEATSVVIADDENLELAKRHGLHTFKRDNRFLGRKFNDGYQQAYKLGADYVVPLGSDSWVHPSYFTPLLDIDDSFLTGRHYGLIDETGRKFGRLEITISNGVGPHVIPVKAMEKHRYRPVQETLKRGCDGSLLDAVARKATWVWNDSDPLQYIAFRTFNEQLNPYESLTKRYLRSESRKPWDELRKMYPDDLVAQAEELYARRRRS